MNNNNFVSLLSFEFKFNLQIIGCIIIYLFNDRHLHLFKDKLIK